MLACILPYIMKIPMSIAMQKQPGGYDNHNPRTQAENLTGFGARALAAHKNSFESLLVFAIAVLTALTTQHVTIAIQNLSILYVVTRIVYNIFYLLDFAALRSIVWGIGFFASLSIIWLCLP